MMYEPMEPPEPDEAEYRAWQEKQAALPPVRSEQLLEPPLSLTEAARVAQIVVDAWKEADHLRGMYNGDLRWIVDRMTGSNTKAEGWR